MNYFRLRIQQIQGMRQSRGGISGRHFVNSYPGEPDGPNLEPGSKGVDEIGFNPMACRLRLGITFSDAGWKGVSQIQEFRRIHHVAEANDGKTVDCGEKIVSFIYTLCVVTWPVRDCE